MCYIEKQPHIVKKNKRIIQSYTRLRDVIIFLWILLNLEFYYGNQMEESRRKV